MEKEVYAAYYDNDDVRLNSSSGGVFSLIANKILEQGGIVYGVTMSSDGRSAEFVKADKKEHLALLRGSKYMQAKVGDTYKNVKRDLEQNRIVLFTGVGCQINGLKLYLGKEYENLLCIDMICHGVPSPKLWKSYVDYLEKKRNSRIAHINFRSKRSRRKEYYMKEGEFQERTVFIPKSEDPFMQLFLTNYSLRPSCYECHSKEFRKSDITLGDFWGIEKVYPAMNDNKGISAVIVRTDKGKKIIESVSSQLHIVKSSYDMILKYNWLDIRSVDKPKERDAFYSDFQVYSFSKLVKMYPKLSCYRKAKYLLRKWLVTFKRKREGLGNYGLEIVFIENEQI